jgi:peptide/nickel transport system substrate-binding protein
MNDDNKQTRRRFLQATGGVAAGVALAGCSGGGGDGDGTDTGTAGGGNDSGDTTSMDDGMETTAGDGMETTAGDETETAGDGTEGEETQGEMEADSEATLQLINSTMTTLDPIASTDTASGRVVQQIYDALMNYPNGQATVETQLAEGYELSDDQTTYTFNINPDATFHNGDSVTAQDFVYSFERLAQSSNSRRTYFILDSLGVQSEMTEPSGDAEPEYKPGSLALNAADETTLEVTLDAPFHSSLEMLAYTSFAAIPEGIVGDIESADGEMEYEEFATSNPIGAGPFEFELWESGTEAEVSRFAEYYGGEASIAGIHWQIIPDPNARYNYSMEKRSDLISIPTAQYAPDKVSVEGEPNDLGQSFGTYGPLRNDETAQYASVPEISSFYVGFNMDTIPKPVRQAFAYVANQEQLVQSVFKGRGKASYHFTPPSIYPDGANAYTQHAEQNWPYGYNQTQVPQAKQVMEEAGYGPDNQFTVQWTQYQDPTWLEMAKLFRDQLSAAHITMEIQQADFSTLLTRGRNGNLDAYTLGWIADWPAPDNFLQLLNPPQTLTSDPAPTSYINWTEENGSASQQAEEAYAKVEDNQAPTDQAQTARNEAYIAIEEANWEDVGFLPIYHSLGERFWYDWVDIEMHGGMGGSRQAKDGVRIGERS